MSFTVPKDVIERLNAIFPRSKDRVRIALSLLVFDHDPSRAERDEIGKAIGKDVRTVENVIEILVKESLFTPEIGSVPMWRIHEKARLDPRLMEKQIPIQAPAQPQAATFTTPIGDDELPVYPISVAEGGEKGVEIGVGKGNGTGGQMGQGLGADGKSMETGINVPIHSDLQLKEIKEMKARQEGFETVVRTELGGIKELLQKALEKPKETPATATEVKVVTGLRGQTQQAAAETPVEQPANPRPAAQLEDPMDPFPGMTKQQVVEFYQNKPPIVGRRLPGGLSETFMNAPPETIRKIFPQSEARQKIAFTLLG